MGSGFQLLVVEGKAYFHFNGEYHFQNDPVIDVRHMELHFIYGGIQGIAKDEIPGTFVLSH